MDRARRHVVLWGPPGSGKSAVGARLAELLGLPFVEVDEAVVRAAGTSIREVFSGPGEPRFRELERAALLSALDAPASVIAPGGGALVDADLRARALRAATVIGLVSTPAARAARLGSVDGDRPLLEAGPGSLEDRLHQLDVARRDAYATFHFPIDTTERSVEAAAWSIAERLQETIALTIEDRAYAAQMCAGTLVDRLADVRAAVRPSSTFVVTDVNVARLHAETLASAARVFDARQIVVPAGEEHKRFTTVETILDAVTTGGGDRDSLLVAMGGGVVSDLTGLSAALFARGIRWLAAPTTLLSMADAAFGGKTGVNLAAGKNLAGAFHHPVAVLVDPTFCATEDASARASGLAEIVKSALVGDEGLLEILEGAARLGVAWEGAQLGEVIRRSLAVKASIVESDPEERGRRVLLNFGHTFGHAIEAAAGPGAWSHGAAVAVGMLVALNVGEVRGLGSRALTLRVRSLLRALGLPTAAPRPLLEAAKVCVFIDKKRSGGDLRFVVVGAPGSAQVVTLPMTEVVNAATLFADEAPEVGQP